MPKQFPETMPSRGVTAREALQSREKRFADRAHEGGLARTLASSIRNGLNSEVCLNAGQYELFRRQFDLAISEEYQEIARVESRALEMAAFINSCRQECGDCLRSVTKGTKSFCAVRDPLITLGDVQKKAARLRAEREDSAAA